MRMNKDAVRMIADNFVRSFRAQIWPFVGEDIRCALIDSAVMEGVRAADANKSMTASELMTFRAMVVLALADRRFMVTS